MQQKKQERAILKRDMLAWRRHLNVLVQNTPRCLPEKWEVRVDPEHRAFYLDHGNQTTTFEPPVVPPGILERLQEQMAGRTSGRNSPHPHQAAVTASSSVAASSSAATASLHSTLATPVTAPSSNASDAASGAGTPEAMAKMKIIKRLRAEWGDEHWVSQSLPATKSYSKGTQGRIEPPKTTFRPKSMPLYATPPHSTLTYHNAAQRGLSSDAKNAAVTDTLRREAEVVAAAAEASAAFVPGVMVVDEATGVRWRMLDVQRQKHFKFYMAKLIELTERLEQLRLEIGQRTFAIRGKTNTLLAIVLLLKRYRWRQR